MASKNTLKGKMTYRIKRSKSSIFLPSDFADISGGRQIRRILKELTEMSLLIRIGYGLYARTKISSVTGERIPEKPITTLALEAMEKLGVEVAPTRGYQEYNSGLSTQVPTGRQIRVKGRISRRISYNGSNINYEAA